MTKDDTSRMKLVQNIYFVWIERDDEQDVILPIRSHWLSVSGNRVRVFPPEVEGRDWSVTLYNNKVDWHKAQVDTARAQTEATAWKIAYAFVRHGE